VARWGPRELWSAFGAAGLMDTGTFVSNDAVTVVGTPMLPDKSLQPTEHSAAAELVRWARDWRSFNI